MLPPTGAGQEFLERTKYRYQGRSDQENGMSRPPLELAADPDLPVFDLPDPASLVIPQIDLRSAIGRRHSVRSYAREPLSLEDLSFLLWCTQGVKSVHGTQATFRTVPSAGARHAFETYLLANDVDGLEPGLYRYLALSHRLCRVKTDPTLHIDIAHACLDQAFVMRCGVVFLWTAVPYRMTWRYGERGYRDGFACSWFSSCFAPGPRAAPAPLSPRPDARAAPRTQLRSPPPGHANLETLWKFPVC